MEERMTPHRVRFAIVIGMMLALSLSTVFAQQTAKKEHAFRGKVEKVDPKTKTLTVNGEKVEGWMMAMTMTYGVDKPEILAKVKAGDQITAKVFDGDFSTLHDVQVAPAAKK
jgi:Cu/Ag efflux protein CusF